MILEKGFFMVLLAWFTACHRSQVSRNLVVLFLSPLNMGGGFPLRALLEGLLMMLILCASSWAWPVVTLIPSCCPSIVVGWFGVLGQVGSC